MATWRRRSVLATCAALSTTGALASIGSTAAESTESEEATSSSGWLDGPEGWSSARGNAANSRHLPLEGEFPKPDTEAWRYDLADAEDVEIAVVEGGVYVRIDNEIRALDAADGELRWENDVGATGAPAVFDDAVYVTGDRHLAALDTADGELEWEREFGTGESLADPTIAFETIYLVVDGALHALDPADGSTEWSVETLDVRADAHFWQSDDREPTSFRPETVAVANGTVYASLEGATFTEERRGEEEEIELSSGCGAVDAETGDRVWGVAFTPPHAGGPVVEPIMARGSSVNVNLGGGEGEYTFDAETGDGWYIERNLRATTETTSVVTYWDVNGDLTVFEGGGRWTVQSDEVYAWQAPLIVGDTLIADHFVPERVESDYPERSLVAFDIADGSDRWVLDFDEEPPDSGGRPIAANENALYLETAEALVALRASDADPGDGDDPEEGDEPDDGNGSDDEGGDGSDCECEDGDGSGGDGDTGSDPDGGEENGDSGSDDETGGSDEDDGSGGNGDDDGSNGEDDAGSDDDATEPDEDDGMPGFTTGAGFLGGAATLEWLRRKAGVDESTGVDEPAE